MLLFSGCATRQVDLQQAENLPPYEEPPPAPQPFEPPRTSKSSKKPVKESPVVKRVVTEKELRAIEQKDSDLHFYRCVEILSRLNGKDKEYIRDDIKKKRVLTAPRDFSAYKTWSPLPSTLTGIDHIPKFILIVKDICFLGWYERGRMSGDTYVCIGRMNTWTKRGMYRVKDKDPNHMSTYPNAYGAPSLMPFALRIYDRVWIHAGDVIGPNCSHGCINVPLYTADKLYAWTQIGTPVLIIESLKDLGKDMRTSIQQKPKAKPGAPVKADPQGSALKTIF